MYTLFTLLIAVAFVANVEGCTRRKPPPPPPPPNAPPAPPVAPPIVTVEREESEQQVGFNKCYRKCNGNYIPLDAQGNKLDLDYASICTAQAPPSSGALSPDFNPYAVTEETAANSGDETTAKDQRGNPCGAESKCVYECSFEVFVEVALTTFSKPSMCGCAFHVNTVKPRKPKGPKMISNLKSAHVANEIVIGDFELVVWNYKSNQIVETIPEFKLQRSEQTKIAIENQLKAQNTQDFSQVTAGFAAEIIAFPKLPESLDLNNPKNFNHVPGLRFTVTQIYSDEKVWDAPAKPQMHKMPNAYQSQCVPFYAHDPFCYKSKKRQTVQGCDGKETNIFMKRFFLFPKSGEIGSGQGATYAARSLISFYTNDDCSHNAGLFTIDQEFTHELLASSPDTELALGTWAWDRVFVDGVGGSKFGTQYVLGVPSKFSSLKQVWDKGFSSIVWEFPTGYKAGGVDTVEKRVLAEKICSKFAPTQEPTTNDKYNEEGRFYKPEANIVCDPFDTTVRSSTCGIEGAPDRSLIAFLNAGEVLNFNKLPTSELLIGRIDNGCNLTPYKEVVFDVLQFSGCPPGQHPRTKKHNKREAHNDLPHLGLVYDEEVDGYVHFLHARGHQALAPAHKRSLKDELDSQIATPPNEENFDMRFATGSTDNYGADSADAGDHPLLLFPETFSAPVNSDPLVDVDVVEALVTTGSDIPVCNRGAIGCSCRLSGALACDIGLVCDEGGKCLPESCRPGQPGCVCNSGKCDGENTECFTPSDSNKNAFCRTKQTCTRGSAGCGCGDNDSCDGEATCAEGQCMLGAGCTAGEPGCSCTENNQCTGAGMQCDPIAFVCLAPRCNPGEPGCRCQDDSSCNTGFECNTELGVCAVFECPKGEPGCQCDDNKQCNNKIGFECKDYTTTGDSRCVADPLPNCFPQTERCQAECGVGNIAICPPCTNGMVLCRTAKDQRSLCEIDPFSPACAPASTLVASMMAVVFAVAALMF